ncbi:MAG: hypothetical protein JNM12_13450 [Alphaproteobacteria bacterium]|nr:hypothetical protein [Alphaproteobacteria bacterium]
MSKSPQDDHYGRHREDGPAVEWASGTKLVLHKDGFTVYGADGGATDVRGVTKINESRQSGGSLIEYSNGSSVTISDSGITVKHGDGASLHYSKDLRPTGEKVPHKPPKPFQP